MVFPRRPPHLDETAIIGHVTNWPDFLAAQPWQKEEAAGAGLPAFWKSSFTWHPAAGVRETLGLQTDGLRSGHVWLNGHNLGECPQKVPLYLPECWLKDGDNDLVVFDLYGSNPEKVKLTRYAASAVLVSRNPDLTRCQIPAHFPMFMRLRRRTR